MERVRVGVVSGRGWQGIDVSSLARHDLISTHRVLARMRREIDAMLAYSSAEIAWRSTPDDGQVGLAKREGFRTPEEFVASISGGTNEDARKFIEVGYTMTREERDAQRDVNGPETDPTPLAPRLLVVRDCVRNGNLSIDAANLITRMLTRIWDRHDTLDLQLSDIERVERMLVERAHGVSATRFVRIVRQLEAQIESGRHALTEELQRHSPGLDLGRRSRSGWCRVCRTVRSA